MAVPPRAHVCTPYSHPTPLTLIQRTERLSLSLALSLSLQANKAGCGVVAVALLQRGTCCELVGYSASDATTHCIHIVIFFTRGHCWGGTDPLRTLRRGVGARHQCPLGSVAGYRIYADVRFHIPMTHNHGRPVHWFSANSTAQLSAVAANRIVSRHSLAIINGQGT